MYKKCSRNLSFYRDKLIRVCAEYPKLEVVSDIKCQKEQKIQ